MIKNITSRTFLISCILVLLAIKSSANETGGIFISFNSSISDGSGFYNIKKCCLKKLLVLLEMEIEVYNLVESVQ